MKIRIESYVEVTTLANVVRFLMERGVRVGSKSGVVRKVFEMVEGGMREEEKVSGEVEAGSFLSLRFSTNVEGQEGDLRLPEGMKFSKEELERIMELGREAVENGEGVFANMSALPKEDSSKDSSNPKDSANPKWLEEV